MLASRSSRYSRIASFSVSDNFASPSASNLSSPLIWVCRRIAGSGPWPFAPPPNPQLTTPCFSLTSPVKDLTPGGKDSHLRCDRGSRKLYQPMPAVQDRRRLMSKFLQMPTNQPVRQVRVYIHQVTLKSVFFIGAADALNLGCKLIRNGTVVGYKENNAGPVCRVQKVSQDSSLYIAQRDPVCREYCHQRKKEEGEKELDHRLK